MSASPEPAPEAPSEARVTKLPQEWLAQAEDYPRDLEEEIGAALLTTHRACEQLLEEARRDAARLLAEAGRERARLDEAAEVERRGLLEQAHRQTTQQLADLKIRIESLKSEEAQLRELIASRRRELAAFVRRAVDELADGAGPGSIEAALHARLPDTTPGDADSLWITHPEA